MKSCAAAPRALGSAVAALLAVAAVAPRALASIAAAAMLAAAAVAPRALAAQTVQPGVTAVTQHVGEFNNETVRYTATVAENVLHDTSGVAQATLITIAYVRDDVADPTRRPVMFLFNGGPGASSSPLHMSAFGPKRRSGPELADNPHSPLDAVDLVFIDPVGTGYSRLRDGGNPELFWNHAGDAATVRQVIEYWLQTHTRRASPRYLAGQSYGTVRAALILGETNELRFDGVLLFALVGGAGGREMPFVTTLPTFAATAWHYERIDRGGRSIDAVYEEAVEFARTEYVSALIQGGSLPAPERARITQRVSSLIGLPPELVERHDLMIGKNTFMFELLRERGLRTGLLDTRVTAARDTIRMSGRDDPALGGGSAPAGRAGAGVRPPSAIETYFTRDLQFRTAEPSYIGVNFDVNAVWDHGNRPDVTRAYARAMRHDPRLRLFWTAGYFDLTTPAYEARYALDRAGVPGDRLVAAYFPGAHSVYGEEENLARLAPLVRRFVSP